MNHKDVQHVVQLVRGLPDLNVKCSQLYVQHVEKKLEFLLSRVKIDLFIAVNALQR